MAQHAPLFRGARIWPFCELSIWSIPARDRIPVLIGIRDDDAAPSRTPRRPGSSPEAGRGDAGRPAAAC